MGVRSSPSCQAVTATTEPRRHEEEVMEGRAEDQVGEFGSTWLRITGGTVVRPRSRERWKEATSPSTSSRCGSLYLAHPVAPPWNLRNRFCSRPQRSQEGSSSTS